MKPRALLINPWIHDFAAFDFWQKPLGLLELGACLRKAGYQVSLIDCLDVHYPGRKDPLPKWKADSSHKFDQEVIPKPRSLKDIPRNFRRYGMPPSVFKKILSLVKKPDVILIASVMTYWYTGVRETIEHVRGLFPNVPIILGGVYATLLPEHALSATGTDYVAIGDFRNSLPKILKTLGLPDILSKDHEFPAWDLYRRLDFGALLTGRGCPCRCPYCSVPVLAPKLVRKDMEIVIEEIRKLVVDFGITDIAFLDDALRVDGDDHLIEILEGVIRQGLKVRFHAINAMHLKGLSQELAALFKRSGFSTLRFGLETVDEKKQKEYGDKAKLEDLKEAIYHLRSSGYQSKDIGIYLLAGLPGQRPDEIEEGIAKVVALGAKPYLSEYSPVPKSPMWGQAVKASRFDIEQEPLFHNNTLIPCAHPDLGLKEISQLKAFAKG